MNQKVEIITSRRQSSMASAWTEYLCVTSVEDGRFRLFTGRYEGIAECSDYYNEETEDYDLPDEIDGKTVNGLDDDYIVGGELQYFEDGQAVEFSSLDEHHVAEWLIRSEWSVLVTLNDVRCGLHA